MKPRVLLYVTHNVFGTFSNSVADDKQEKLATSQVPCHSVNRLRFVCLGRACAYQVEEDVAFLSKRLRYFTLEVFVAL